VSLERISQLEVDVPDLEPAVPTDRNEVGVNTCILSFVKGTESNLTDPIAVVSFFTGIFAFSEGVE